VCNSVIAPGLYKASTGLSVSRTKAWKDSSSSAPHTKGTFYLVRVVRGLASVANPRMNFRK
jgi:hypothetical protein